MQSRLVELARRLMNHTAAPLHEAAVRDEIELIAREHDLDCCRDRFGNLRVQHLGGGRSRPIVLAAHMDHPGFELARRLGPRRWHAKFLGGVGDDYFKPGIELRLMPGAVPARLGRRLGTGKEFELIASAKVESEPRFAVWELQDFVVADGRIVGRACDDLVGVASALATIIELKTSRSRVNVIGLISRAEEIGFYGALAAAAARSVPEDAWVISLETSKELPSVRMGDGVILRVGDKASVFDSAGMRFLAEIAGELVVAGGGFRFQRALMSGGTCEATAYQEFGYQTAAVCVALGNYHNCGPNQKIAAEFVSLADAESMTRLLVEAGCRFGEFAALTGRLPKRLRGYLRDARKALC